MSNREPTEAQAEVLRVICLGMLTGEVPSIREIGEARGIRSPNGVNGHLTALKKKNRLVHTESESRAFGLPGGVIYLPIRGSAERLEVSSLGLSSAEDGLAGALSEALLQLCLPTMTGEVRQLLIYAADSSFEGPALNFGWLSVFSVKDEYAEDDCVFARSGGHFFQGNWNAGLEQVFGAVIAKIRLPKLFHPQG